MRYFIYLLTAVLLSGTAAAKNRAVKQEKGMETTTIKDFRQIPFKTIDGAETRLADFEGKVLLLVNVASECGYTPQYKGLQELFQKYKDQGLVVIGFPANNFGEQEPGTNEEIKKFCTTNYNVTFPMMSKISVLGDDKHPLFTYLTEKSKLPGEIKWNFGKFLLDREGNLVARFGHKDEPMSEATTSQIESLLKK